MPNWLGDIIMALPALDSLRHTYPHYTFYIATHEKYASFYRMQGFSHIVSFSGRWDRQAIRAIRTLRCHIGILFTNSFYSALFFSVCGVRKSIGYRKEGRSIFLSKSYALDTSLHQSDQFMYLAHGMRPIQPTAPYVLRVPPSLTYWAKDALSPYGTKPLVALGIGAAYGHTKEWGEKNYMQLAQTLLSDYGCRVMLLGTANEKDAATHITHSLGHPNLINMAGKTSLTEAVTLISLCAAFVGNDSGLAHVAASLSIPTFTIFGSTSPEKTAPRSPSDNAIVIQHPMPCAPCFSRTCKIETLDCMRYILPQTILHAMQPVLKNCHDTPPVEADMCHTSPG